MIMLIISVLFQIDPTPTPFAGFPNYVATLDAKIEEYQETWDEIQALSEDIEIDEDGNVTILGQDLNPEMDTATYSLTLSYAKWLTGSSAYTLFGPFAEIMVAIAILISLNFAEPLAMMLRTLWQALMAILGWIRRYSVIIVFLIIGYTVWMFIRDVLPMMFGEFFGWFGDRWQDFSLWLQGTFR